MSGEGAGAEGVNQVKKFEQFRSIDMGTPPIVICHNDRVKTLPYHKIFGGR